jgi:PAS domain S-box-containing protein
MAAHPNANSHSNPPMPPGGSSDAARVAELEAELARMTRALSRRVAARTADLRKSNEQLYQELIGRREAEHSLRATEEKYRGFFDHAVEGAYQSTPAGKYLSINPALARLYGYASVGEMQDAVGDIAEDIYVDPTMRQRFQAMIERDGEVRNLEYQVRRRDGTAIWISENARVARGWRGKVLYYEGTIQDITRRKLAEAEAARLGLQLLQAQKMEAVGTLAGGIAHDFNNILAAILGYAEMALEDIPPDSPASASIAEVIKAARRAREHVRQILTFSRQSAPLRKPVRVGEIVREVVGLMRSTIPSRIRIEREDLTDNDWAVADAGQLHQVLVNLCANASQAMAGRDGELWVRLENVNLVPPMPAPLGHLAPGDFLKLSVRDTGTGIPPDVLPRIFEPFFTTKPVGEGTGLGLSVVHGIVRDHGGEIQVETAPGTGTTFTVWLPGADAATLEPAATSTRLSGAGQRIMVVDDEEVLNALYTLWLERLGYASRTHTSSLAALEEIQAAPGQYDLVITDQTMPELTGVQLAKAIREVRPDLPVILCTGRADDLEVASNPPENIRRVLQKPMDLAQFSEAIGGVLQAPGKEAT